MRTILFRGKRVDTGEWIYGYYMYQKEEDKHIIVDTTRGILGLGIQVYAETVGEYTSLTDKNGNMIYEGDIVRRGDGTIWLVEFHNGAFCVKQAKNDYTYIYEHIIFSTNLEVIGNKFDNPELLKENNNDK